ncbi:MAG: hypothetical protein LAN71_12670 [Acidobacteriia bacterium]|nr:hypothetical protein [Terriglobia bacterium]
MNKLSRTLAALAGASLLLLAVSALAQSAKQPPAPPPPQSAPAPAVKGDRWLHIRVDGSAPKKEMVRVNLPIELAIKVLPAIHNEHLNNGRVKLSAQEMHDADLRVIIDAVRSSKDGEFVTVQSNEHDVRVAKQGGTLLIRVHEKKADKKEATHVEVRVPMKVVDALLSAGHDELDVAAALNVLAAQGDTELVTVKDGEQTVRIWLDGRNSSEEL